MVFNAFKKIIHSEATAFLLKRSVTSGCGSQGCVCSRTVMCSSAPWNSDKHCPGHLQYCIFIMITIITGKSLSLTKMCSYTLVWWASGIFKGNPISSYQAEAHGKGHLHKHLITLKLTAISLVSFVSVPPPSSTTGAAAAEPCSRVSSFASSRAVLMALSLAPHQNKPEWQNPDIPCTMEFLDFNQPSLWGWSGWSTTAQLSCQVGNIPPKSSFADWKTGRTLASDNESF